MGNHDDVLIFLRAIQFLGPLFLTFYFGWKQKDNERILVGGLFSFLYSIALILPAFALANHLGMWDFGGNTLMLLGVPADSWFAWSFLFGPAIFFAQPKLNPLVFVVILIAVQVLFFKSLHPFVTAGDYWFIGIALILLVVHIPAQYLARWTAFDMNLIARACILAFGYGFLAFFVLPTLIMQAMGGEWDFQSKSVFNYTITALLLTPCVVLGLTAVHMFVVHGEGTPIPFDNTKHLVRSGIYSYVTNPMQLCSALSWIVIGLFLHNAYVALAAVMAAIFVLGLVRWHHSHDLQVRFPDGWPEYKNNVPEWRLRWKPWIKHPSKFTWSANSSFQKQYVHWLKRHNPTGLEFVATSEDSHQFIDGNRGRTFSGFPGLVYPLFHVNFLTALLASGLLLIEIPGQLIKKG